MLFDNLKWYEKLAHDPFEGWNPIHIPLEKILIPIQEVLAWKETQVTTTM